jgi:hypothetical protein
MNEGIIVYNVRDYQAAVAAGGDAYRQRFGLPPTHVALPCCVNPAELELWTLRLWPYPASPGTVQVWRENGDGKE